MDLLNLNLNKTGDSKKLSIQGQTKHFDVFRIPLEKLIYNKKNGRIATYVSQYLDEGNQFPSEKDIFNEIIEEYIVKSNPDALSKTKQNIRLLSQTEPAVVLSDGIVVDGNRRFTSLRQLSREGAGTQFNYLEAVILDRSKYSEKDIKRLELNLQHAVESRVDYNPIDRLVDIYRDLIENGGVFTSEEYMLETQMSSKKIKEEIEVAKLMIQYLEYIKKPLKFHVAREQKIDGPLREVYSILKSPKIDSNKISDIRDFLFTNIISLNGDVTRRIRALKAVFEDRNLANQILSKIDELELLDDVEDSLEINSQTETVELDKNICDKITDITETYVERKKIQNAKNQPLEILNKAFRQLQEIDRDLVIRLNTQQRDEFQNLLRAVEKYVEELGDI
jgi:hypothetical protein